MPAWLPTWRSAPPTGESCSLQPMTPGRGAVFVSNTTDVSRNSNSNREQPVLSYGTNSEMARSSGAAAGRPSGPGAGKKPFLDRRLVETGRTALLPRRSRRRLNYLPVAGAPRTRGHTASGRVGGIRNPHAAQRQRSLERHGRPPGAMRLPIYIPYRRLRNHRPREPRCQGRNHGLRQRRGDPRC